jgi:hypothetical protein
MSREDPSPIMKQDVPLICCERQRSFLAIDDSYTNTSARDTRPVRGRLYNIKARRLMLVLQFKLHSYLIGNLDMSPMLRAIMTGPDVFARLKVDVLSRKQVRLG